MAKIIAPNKDYAGVSAGVAFQDGAGYTDDPYLVEWFRSHGYTVEEKKPVRAAGAETRKPARRKKEG